MQLIFTRKEPDTILSIIIAMHSFTYFTLLCNVSLKPSGAINTHSDDFIFRQ